MIRGRITRESLWGFRARRHVVKSSFWTWEYLVESLVGGFDPPMNETYAHVKLHHFPK